MLRSVGFKVYPVFSLCRIICSLMTMLTIVFFDIEGVGL